MLPDMPHGFMAVPCEMTGHWYQRTLAWFTNVLARDDSKAASA